LDPNAVAAVGVKGGANIPPLESVGGPGAACFGFDVGENATTRGAQWCAIVVECAMDLGIGGELGVDAGSAEEVEHDFSLGDKCCKSK